MRNAESLSVADDFDKRADKYEERSFWTTDKVNADAVYQLLDGLNLGRVIDVGGGTGSMLCGLLERLPYFSAMVVDVSPKMLQQVPEHIQTMVSSLEGMPIPATRLDTILLRQVLHYVDDPGAAIEKLKELLASAGRIYIGQLVAPNPQSAEWLADIGRKLSPNRRRVWTIDSLLTTVREHDLKLLKGRVHDFTDSIAAWTNRRTASCDKSSLLRYARSTLTPSIASSLGINSNSQEIEFEILWFHGLFTVEPSSALDTESRDGS